MRQLDRIAKTWRVHYAPLSERLSRLRTVMLVTGALCCDARPATPTGRRRNRKVTARCRHWEWVAHMRGIAGRVNMGILLVCLFFGVVVAAIGAAGVVAVRSATAVGATIAGDELTTAAVTSGLGR